MLHNLICLPFLKAEAETLVRIVLVIRLIFVKLDLDEVAVDGGWVEGQGDYGVDGGSFGDDFESPRLYQHTTESAMTVNKQKQEIDVGHPTCSFLN